MLKWWFGGRWGCTFGSNLVFEILKLDTIWGGGQLALALSNWHYPPLQILGETCPTRPPVIYVNVATLQCWRRYYVFGGCPFIRIVRSSLCADVVTTISHKRRWNLQGITGSPYWWAGYMLVVKGEVDSRQSRWWRHPRRCRGAEVWEAGKEREGSVFIQRLLYTKKTAKINNKNWSSV